MLKRVAELASTQDWLAVLVTMRKDGTPATSVVNAAIVPHPLTGETVVAFVSRGRTQKLRNLRVTPQAILVFRAGWDWVSVSGPVEIAGPDDPMPGVELPKLLRDIYTAAGGTHSDFAEYDREMVQDRRAAVLMQAQRFTTNPGRHDRE